MFDKSKKCTGLLFLLLFSAACGHRLAPIVVVMRGEGMIPAINDGDKVLLERVINIENKLCRGDVVYFRDPVTQKNTLKRIVGLPGETVTITRNTVIVGEQVLLETSESLLFPPHYHPNPEKHIYHVGTNEYFVLGDNIIHSYDSRHYGPIKGDSINSRMKKVLGQGRTGVSP